MKKHPWFANISNKTSSANFRRRFRNSNFKLQSSSTGMHYTPGVANTSIAKGQLVDRT